MQNVKGEKIAFGFGVTELWNMARKLTGRAGVVVAVKVADLAGVGVMDGVKVRLGVRVIEGIGVMEGVTVMVGEGGKYS